MGRHGSSKAANGAGEGFATPDFPPRQSPWKNRRSHGVDPMGRHGHAPHGRAKAPNGLSMEFSTAKIPPRPKFHGKTQSHGALGLGHTEWPRPRSNGPAQGPMAASKLTSDLTIPNGPVRATTLDVCDKNTTVADLSHKPMVLAGSCAMEMPLWRIYRIRPRY